MNKQIRKPFIIVCLATVILITSYAVLVIIGFNYIDNLYDKLSPNDLFTPKNIPYSFLSKEFQAEITKDEYISAVNGENAEVLYKLFTKMGEISQTFDKYEIYNSNNIHKVTKDLIADMYTFQSDEYKYTVYYNLYFVYNCFNPFDVIFKNIKLCDFDIAASIKNPI